MKKMILGWLVLLSTMTVSGQTTLTLTGPPTTTAGSTVTLSLSAAGATNTGTGAFQWLVSPPSGYTETAALGAASTAAAKTLGCTSDSTFCILYGINTNVIGNGVLATYTVNVPATATPGPAAFTLSTVSAASVTNSVVPITLGTPYVITVLDPRDISAPFGVIDASDVAAYAGIIVAAQTNPAACTPALDFDKDGKCTIYDLMKIVLKILGGP